MLHDDKQTFEQFILKTSDYLGVTAEIIEIDYFVTLFLNAMIKLNDFLKNRKISLLKAKENR